MEPTTTQAPPSYLKAEEDKMLISLLFDDKEFKPDNNGQGQIYNQLTDTVLICKNNSKIHVHSFILMAHSRLLRDLFLIQNSPDIFGITLDDYDPELIQAIVNYLYLGKVFIDPTLLFEFNNILEILQIKHSPDLSNGGSSSSVSEGGGNSNGGEEDDDEDDDDEDLYIVKGNSTFPEENFSGLNQEPRNQETENPNLNVNENLNANLTQLNEMTENLSEINSNTLTNINTINTVLIDPPPFFTPILLESFGTNLPATNSNFGTDFSKNSQFFEKAISMPILKPVEESDSDPLKIVSHTNNKRKSKKKSSVNKKKRKISKDISEESVDSSTKKPKRVRKSSSEPNKSSEDPEKLRRGERKRVVSSRLVESKMLNLYLTNIDGNKTRKAPQKAKVEKKKCKGLTDNLIKIDKLINEKVNEWPPPNESERINSEVLLNTGNAESPSEAEAIPEAPGELNKEQIQNKNLNEINKIVAKEEQVILMESLCKINENDIKLEKVVTSDEVDTADANLATNSKSESQKSQKSKPDSNYIFGADYSCPQCNKCFISEEAVNLHIERRCKMHIN